jgi:hypothetical protein
MSIRKAIFAGFILNIAVFGLCRAELDRSRYIGLDEIKAGDKAVCHTVFKGQLVEKFDFEVVSVVRGKSPGRDAILMMGMDERFKHTNGISGASGSPMYIDGRIAGALAFGWMFSKDPLVGVTPIEEMLEIGKYEPQSRTSAGQNFIDIDYSKPIDITQAGLLYRDNFVEYIKARSQDGRFGLTITSSLSGEGLSFAREFFGEENFTTTHQAGSSGDGAKYETTFEPGSLICVPVVSGDISLGAYGTVTDVVGDKIYAFGHPGFGIEESALPISAGYVHTIVSSMMSSFKYAKPVGPVLGSLVYDEGAGVICRTDQMPPLIPVNVTVKRYNDIERTYKCMAADTKGFSPMAVASAVYGAVMNKGFIPRKNLIEYKCVMKLDNGQAIDYSNVISGEDFRPAAFEIMGTVGLLMNNPYKRGKIVSADFDVKISNENLVSIVRDIEVSDTKISAGDTVDITVITEKYLSGVDSYDFSIEVPKDLKLGKYEIFVMGRDGYLGFIKKQAAHKFIAEDFDELVSSVKRNLYPKRNSIYLIMPLPSAGITLDRAELADLPPSKAIVLASSKRTVRTMPYNRWIEKQKTVNAVIQNQMNITIEVQDK